MTSVRPPEIIPAGRTPGEGEPSVPSRDETEGSAPVAVGPWGEKVTRSEGDGERTGERRVSLWVLAVVFILVPAALWYALVTAPHLIVVFGLLAVLVAYGFSVFRSMVLRTPGTHGAEAARWRRTARHRARDRANPASTFSGADHAVPKGAPSSSGGEDRVPLWVPLLLPVAVLFWLCVAAVGLWLFGGSSG